MPTEKSTRHATGPTTVMGKARSRLNAIKHGALSSQLVLPSENAEEFQQLLNNLTHDLEPIGTLEQVLVQNIAAVLWRKQRLEKAETAALAAMQLRDASDDELREHLALGGLPDWMYEYVGIEPWGCFKSKPLPGWMGNESKEPSESDGKRAEQINAEWQLAQLHLHAPSSPRLAQLDFPLHWQVLTQQAESTDQEEAIAYLGQQYEGNNFLQSFRAFMVAQQRHYYWVAYWHRHRAEMATAFQAIRAKRLQEEWEMECAHRYHTMLDRQFFRLLKEFRDMRDWRLSTLDTAKAPDTDKPGFAH